MKLLKYSPLILTLLAKQPASAQYPSAGLSRLSGDKTKLLPIEWYGNINPILDDWMDNETLTSLISNVNGPFHGRLRGEKRGKLVKAHIEYAKLSGVLDAFDNDKLNELVLKYPVLSSNYDEVFGDGRVTSKEELDQIRCLKEGTYIFPFVYKSDDGEDSKYGIFLIKNYFDNFLYKPAEKIQPAKEKEQVKPKVKTDYNKLEQRIKSLEQKLDKSFRTIKALDDSDVLRYNEIEGIKEEIDDLYKSNSIRDERLDILSERIKNLYGLYNSIRTQDSTKIEVPRDSSETRAQERDSLQYLQTPEISELYKNKIDSLKQELKGIEDIEKVLSEKGDTLDVLDKKSLEITIEEKKKIISEIDSLESLSKKGKNWYSNLLSLFSRDTTKFKRKTGLEVAVGYDFDNFYTLEARYGGNVRYGAAIGFSPKNTRTLTTPVINNFYGEGSDEKIKFFVAPNIGIDLGKYVTFNAALGLDIESEKVVEEIKRSNRQALSTNKDSYVNLRGRGYLGLDANVNKFSVGPKLVFDGNKLYAGLMARYRF